MLAPAPAPAVFRFSRPAARRGGGSRRRRGDDVDVPWKRGGRRSTEVAPTHFRGADIPRRRESRRRRGCKIDIPRRRESRRRRGRGRGCFVAESRRARRERKRRREGAVARDVQLRLEAFQRRRLAPVLHALFLLFFRFRPRVWVDDVVLRRLRDKRRASAPTTLCPYARQHPLPTPAKPGAPRRVRRRRRVLTQGNANIPSAETGLADWRVGSGDAARVPTPQTSPISTRSGRLPLGDGAAVLLSTLGARLRR